MYPVSYNERVDYLRSGALPSHMGAHQGYRLKQGIKRYSRDHCLRAKVMGFF